MSSLIYLFHGCAFHLQNVSQHTQTTMCGNADKCNDSLQQATGIVTKRGPGRVDQVVDEAVRVLPGGIAPPLKSAPVLGLGV